MKIDDERHLLDGWLDAHTAWILSQGIHEYPKDQFRGVDRGLARYPILRGIQDADLLYGAGHAQGYSEAYQEIWSVLSIPEARGREVEALTMMVVEAMPYQDVIRRFMDDAKAGRGKVRHLREVGGQGDEGKYPKEAMPKL